jgi:hypothetical protein
LPTSSKIHPSFHVALLDPYRGKPEVRIIPPVEADDEGWIPEAIIACGPTADNHSKHVFLTKWIGFSNHENTWETGEQLSDREPNLIEEYYDKNPSIKKCKGWTKPDN